MNPSTWRLRLSTRLARVRSAVLGVVAVMIVLAGPMGVPGPGPALAADPSSTTTSTTAPVGDAQQGAATTGDGQFPGLKDDYDKILADQATLLTKLADTVQKRQGVQLELYALDLQIQKATAHLHEAEAAYNKANDLYDAAQKDLSAATKKMDDARDQMRRQAISSYVSGGNNDDLLRSILNVNSSDVAGQTVTYADAMVLHQKTVIKDFRTARDARDKSAKAAASARDNTKTHQDEVLGLRDGLKAQRTGRAGVEKALAAQQFVEQLAFGELDKRKLDIVIKSIALRREADGIADQINLAQKGQPPFVFPLVPLQDPVPNNTTLTQGFGPQGQPVLGIQGFHPGIDLAGPQGEPIAAAADGVVLVAGPLGGYGNAVIIDHGNHLATLYGHQEQVIAKVGDHVKQGDIIGLRGTTGFSTGPHVHFETRVYGVPVDPFLFIKLP